MDKSSMTFARSFYHALFTGMHSAKAAFEIAQVRQISSRKCRCSSLLFAVASVGVVSLAYRHAWLPSPVS